MITHYPTEQGRLGRHQPGSEPPFPCWLDDNPVWDTAARIAAARDDTGQALIPDTDPHNQANTWAHLAWAATAGLAWSIANTPNDHRCTLWPALSRALGNLDTNLLRQLFDNQPQQVKPPF